jgi:HEAT repeat protein
VNQDSTSTTLLLLVARRARRALCLVSIAVIATLLSSCGGCSDPVVVKKVLVDVDAAAVAGGVDREQVRSVVEGVVDDVHGIRVNDDGGDRVLRVRIESVARTRPDAAAAPLPPDHAAVPATATLSLAVEVAENGRVLLRGTAVSTMSGDAPVGVLVAQALRDALDQVVQANATDRLSSDELLTLLQSPTESAQRRRRAMMTLASRRDLRSTPLVTPLLRDDDASMRLAALQSLTLLADPRAVEAIIDYSDRQPAAVRRQCIDAVKATDSPLAAAWLFVLSTGHPDANVQAHARAALALLPASARGDDAPTQVAATSN